MHRGAPAQNDFSVVMVATTPKKKMPDRSDIREIVDAKETDINDIRDILDALEWHCYDPWDCQRPGKFDCHASIGCFCRRPCGCDCHLR